VYFEVPTKLSKSIFQLKKMISNVEPKNLQFLKYSSPAPPKERQASFRGDLNKIRDRHTKQLADTQFITQISLLFWVH